MPQVSSPRQTVEQLLQAAIGPDPGSVADCYAASVEIEMPFAAASLYPQRIDTTREALRDRFRSGATMRRYQDLDDAVIHETTDPEVVITEYRLHGELIQTGESFSQRFVMVVTVRDGLIVHTRDYTNPITAARLLGRIPELLAELGAPNAGSATRL